MQKSCDLSYKIENILSKNGLIIKTLEFQSINEVSITTDLLTQKELNELSQFNSSKRKNEFYYTRVLWKSFSIEQEIFYDELGRPRLKSGFISISHSRTTIAIAYHRDHKVGIDVEYYSPKINLVKNKFISESDKSLIDFENDIDLTIVWSIKEAVYKMESIEGLSFKDNIHVALNKNKATVKVRKSNYFHHYSFSYVLFDFYVLSYCQDSDLEKTSQIE